tara:strand:+ start:252 stop:557 length:306 start_codon:yes stop_codon:yes gene_type:complete
MENKQKLKNDECVYYIKGEPAFSLERKEGKVVVTKWFEPWDMLIITTPNDTPLYTEYGDEWFGVFTVSDIKMLAFGADEFVVSDEMISKLNLIVEKKHDGS